jgi:hypothetical protein
MKNIKTRIKARLHTIFWKIALRLFPECPDLAGLRRTSKRHSVLSLRLVDALRERNIPDCHRLVRLIELNINQNREFARFEVDVSPYHRAKLSNVFGEIAKSRALMMDWRLKMYDVRHEYNRAMLGKDWHQCLRVVEDARKDIREHIDYLDAAIKSLSEY